MIFVINEKEVKLTIKLHDDKIRNDTRAPTSASSSLRSGIQPCH